MSVPSSRKLFCSGRAPLIEIFGVRPPTTSLPAASAACTPGCSSASCWNDRPLSGRSRISRSPTRPLTDPLVRWMRGASPDDDDLFRDRADGEREVDDGVLADDQRDAAALDGLESL